MPDGPDVLAGQDHLQDAKQPASESGVVGAPILAVLFLLGIGAASLVPLVFGLIGFRLRATCLWAAVFLAGIVALEIATFSLFSESQSPYRVPLADLKITAVLSVLLLLPFLVCHWIGVLVRHGIRRLRRRTR